jgi:transcription elongation factor Elf1
MKGSRHQKIGRKRYPLRKIVKTRRDEHGLVVEVLECGHEQRPVQDFIGETNAARRRCRKCAAEQFAANVAVFEQDVLNDYSDVD